MLSQRSCFIQVMNTVITMLIDFAEKVGNHLQGQNAKLNIGVDTDDGSLEISVEDTDDKTIFSETISEVTSFSVEIAEKIIVSVLGK